MEPLTVDYSAGTVHLTLRNAPARSFPGGRVKLDGSYTWPVDQDVTLKWLALYGTVRVRDWRWLWLRRKTRVVVEQMIQL